MRPGRGRRILLLGGVSLASVVLTFGLVELVGRLFLMPLLLRYSDNQALKQQMASPKDLGMASLYVPHHYYLYETRPSYRSADGRIRHNAMGCRAEDVALEKAPDVYRIVTIGGSTTYGTGVTDNDKVFTYRLQALLDDWAGRQGVGRKFEVLNCGVPAATSAENLSRYIFSLSQYRADLLVIQQGFNDVYPRILPHMARDYRHFAKSWDESVAPTHNIGFIRRLVRVVQNRFRDSVWNQGVNYLVRHPFWDVEASGVAGRHMTTNGPEVFEANTRYLITLAAADGTLPLLLTEHFVVDRSLPWRTMPYTRARAISEHNEVLERLARAEKTLFLDVQARLCACAAIMPDDRHLNEEGERQKAQLIFDYLTREVDIERWLKTRPGARAHAPGRRDGRPEGRPPDG
jgi:lysophospholipase L1-like esterase